MERGQEAGPAVRMLDVAREFGAGEQCVRALDGVSLEISRCEQVAFIGQSGSGKSTLLNLLAGIDRPTRGQVWIDGQELTRLDDARLTRLRRDRIGMVYQFFNLLPTLTVRENVALPALLSGYRERAVLPKVDAYLEEVGLTERRQALPHTLSGGEMQRTAIARALINDPALILADEPTGNLDSRSAEAVLKLLLEVTRRHGSTLLLVTHSSEIAGRMGRLVELRDGRVIRDQHGGRS